MPLPYNAPLRPRQYHIRIILKFTIQESFRE